MPSSKQLMFILIKVASFVLTRGLYDQEDTGKERQSGSWPELGEGQEATGHTSITLLRGVPRLPMRNSFWRGSKFLEMQQRRAWSTLSGGFETENMDTYEMVHDSFPRLNLPRNCMHSPSDLSEVNELFHQMDSSLLLSSWPISRPSWIPVTLCSWFLCWPLLQRHPLLTRKPESIYPSMPGTPLEGSPLNVSPLFCIWNRCIGMPAKAFYQMAPPFLLA